MNTLESISEHQQHCMKLANSETMKTWLKLLQGWGLTGDQEITRKVLVDSGFRGTRPDEPTAARLSNADEIFKVLKNTQFSHYFRQ